MLTRTPESRAPRTEPLRADDLHAVALEGELAVDIFDARPALHIVQHPLLHARAHPELSARRIDERKIAQVAAHAHANVASGAGNHRLCQPVTRLTAQHQRQVRAQPAGVDAVEDRGQVERAGPFPAPGIAAEQVAAEIRVGEGERRHTHRERAAGVALPAELAAQRAQPDARLREYLRQLELRLP